MDYINDILKKVINISFRAEILHGTLLSLLPLNDPCAQITLAGDAENRVE